MFKFNNKDTFAPCSSVSIVNFEHVIADWKYFVKIAKENQQQ